jgi:uncharacterized protein YecE (DUF72 family)
VGCSGWNYKSWRGRLAAIPIGELDRWAHVLAEQTAAGRQVFAYFNNDPEAVATANALTLRDKLARLV